MSEDATDFEALSQSYILFGLSQPNIEPRNYESFEVNYRKKWRTAQAYTNLFWKGWLSEYLPAISPRPK